MNHPDVDFMIVMERRRDELAEAALSRQIKEAMAGNKRKAQPNFGFKISNMRDELLLILARFLSSIGGRMLNWSCQLQTRYEMLKEDVVEKRVSPC